MLFFLIRKLDINIMGLNKLKPEYFKYPYKVSKVVKFGIFQKLPFT